MIISIKSDTVELMQNEQQTTIQVTVDKNHLIALGERMYIESIELIRELVNNAYDADATEVKVIISEDKIIVEDNGSGMNEKGLEQFFTVGSGEKRVHSISPRFGRKRIGQFGIGKFAALAAADCFMIESVRNNFHHAVVFDRQAWQQNDNWTLPIFTQTKSPFHNEGTKVTLTQLKKVFCLSDIERHLQESVPLRAKKFTVLVNNKIIGNRYILGRRFAFNQNTIYGKIEGEIVVAARSNDIDQLGIECRVNHILICRGLFGLEKDYSRFIHRITGEANADFLPLLASRHDFVRDSAEFKLFHQVVKNQLQKVLDEIKKEADTKHLKKINQELQDAMKKIRQALELNPNLTPSGKLIAERKKRLTELASDTIKKDHQSPGSEKSDADQRSQKSLKQEEKERVIKESNPEAIKRIRLPHLGVSVAIAALGVESNEVISSANLIYINSDHTLYRELYQKKEQFSLHLLRLITQELVLMKKLRISAEEAFRLQSQLLKDAIVQH